MVAYFDNDALHKLAAFDLVEVGLRVLGLAPNQVHVLATAKFKFGLFKGREKAERQFGTEVLRRIESFIMESRETGAPEFEDMKALLDSGLDQGEAILVAHSHREPDSILVTGDKRALRRLAQAPQCAAMAAALAGRVECVEQIVLRAIPATGFADVRNRVVRGMACDTSIRAAFGSGERAEQVSVVTALESFVDDLRRDTGNLLRS